ncbi:urease subunit alpha [Camelimonas fluminis]|nr:urease subunit alpha [Camelimonas fluminis]
MGVPHRETRQDWSSGMAKISRRQYADLYGPTTGDKIRLGDTNLFVEIEKDLRVYGEEAVYGGGKTLRDGMGYDNELTSAAGAPDLVITNVTIIDGVQGVIKADVGVKDGLICGIGKAGNPAIMPGVTPGLALGAGTDAISGEHLILTAGGIDAHVHFISPQQAEAALSNGVTTLFGGGIGPTDGTNGTTITPGTWNIEMMLRSFDAWPVNAGVLGKGNCSSPAPMVEQLHAGAMGFKIHEDWGSTPAAIRACLGVADEYDVQVCIHTDTLNEAGFVENTIAAFEGRTIHTYHTEGAGGGHAPDIIRVAGVSNVIPSSTNPTLPYGINSQAELFDMTMICHNLSPKIPTDVAFAESRVRVETIAAENVLHDMGAISILSSDSQAMGRVGENWARTIQTAHLMKARRGAYAGDASGNDNERVLRFVSKVTINPAIAQGVSHVIGSVEVGKMADLVLWSPAFFGAKPKMVIKGGMISWALMGDPNASLPTPQPVIYRPMFGAMGSALAKTRVTFTSHAGFEDGIAERYALQSQVIPVYGTRTISKASMVRNATLPSIEVNPETFAVTVDGEHATIEPATELPLTQLHFFS